MSTQNVTRLIQICLLILRVNRKIRDSVTAVVSQENLSLESWLILSSLDEKGGMSVSELSDFLGMRISGVSKNIDRLVKRALLYRQQDTDDNRRVLLFVSDFGREKMARLESQIEHLSIAVQNSVNEQNLDLFVDFLENSEMENILDTPLRE